jgi:carbon storage regulator
MLVLERRLDEVIIIGNDIRVMVVSVSRNGKVKLGIQAPEGVQIDRLEIRQAKEAGKRDLERGNWYGEE